MAKFSNDSEDENYLILSITHIHKVSSLSHNPMSLWSIYDDLPDFRGPSSNVNGINLDVLPQHYRLLSRRCRCVGMIYRGFQLQKNLENWVDPR